MKGKKFGNCSDVIVLTIGTIGRIAPVFIVYSHSDGQIFWIAAMAQVIGPT